MTEEPTTASPFGLLEGVEAPNLPVNTLDHGFEPEAEPENDIEASRARAWTTRTILGATLLLAVLNAHALQSWATTLPPEWGGQAIRNLAEAWYSATSSLGLDRPRAAIHAAYEAKKTLAWGDLAGATPKH